MVNRTGAQKPTKQKYHTESFYLVKHQAMNDGRLPRPPALPLHHVQGSKRSFQTLRSLLLVPSSTTTHPASSSGARAPTA